jgi:hypothetical protein
VSLERRPAGGPWQKLTDLAVGADGAFGLPFKGERTTDYRLSTARLKSAPLRVKVASRVTLKAAPGGVSGVVRPVLPGVIVTIQRQAGTRWTPAGTATVDEQGAYTAELALEPGVYRARVAPRPGYAVGLSKTLTVE